jgi:PIN domain nuclease of toxin-antitoxin system
MIAAVADTHTIIWYLYADARLSRTARSTIDDAIDGQNTVLISSITLVEIVYLIEKSRIAAETLIRLSSVLNDPGIPIDQFPINLAVAHALSRVNRDQVPDMPDRIIAATALYLKIPLISRDGKIKASAVTTIW